MPIGESEKVRIDRWLWSVRLFKTRSQATEACKKNWVKVEGNPAKPSKFVNIGDVIAIKLGPLEKVVLVEALIEKRTSAPLVAKYLKDLTTPEAYQKAKEQKLPISARSKGGKGLGRPTKKQRRELEDFLYPDQPTE